MTIDYVMMARALRLAEKGLTTAHPNPRVGCVNARGERVLGEGFHVRTGGPHAEIEALSRVTGDAAGATAYVTLEPCCHQGRTPPCTDRLIEAGVARVVAVARPRRSNCQRIRRTISTIFHPPPRSAGSTTRRSCQQK